MDTNTHDDFGGQVTSARDGGGSAAATQPQR